MKPTQELRVALMTGGGDRPYALGLATALASRGVRIDFIGSDAHVDDTLLSNRGVRFLNLRGTQSRSSAMTTKAFRVLRYYYRLLAYTATTRTTLVHILWHNKFELFDRTLLLIFYRLTGKRILFTAHNINKEERDGTDSWLNRLTLRWQYALCDHIFVHTERMAATLEQQYAVARTKITTIPFGVNRTSPQTILSKDEARHRLGIAPHDCVLLFFGYIARYKGLDVLVRALSHLGRQDVKLIVAGEPKQGESYWQEVSDLISRLQLENSVLLHVRYVPEGDVELFFKAADALVLPYTFIFQSGVLFLGYNFGLPVIATDVGDLREYIIEGVTGFLCAPADPDALAERIVTYLSSSLYRNPSVNESIRMYATTEFSWDIVAERVARTYAAML